MRIASFSVERLKTSCPFIMNYTYILECSDSSLYTGWTNNLEKRLQTHQAGKGGKYTRSHLPVRLVYFEKWDTKNEAMSREYAIKHMTREEKLSLVSEFQKKNSASEDLPAERSAK